MRYALYFTPPYDSPLERFGRTLLGYDAYTGASAEPSLPGEPPPTPLRDAVADPRRYGFHATLKAPFRLVQGRTEPDLTAAVERFAAETPPVGVGPLAPRLLGAFIALTPVAEGAALLLLAAECVAALDAFRAPLTEADRARRLRSPLSGRQAALLERWGYPHVFDAFRFHMTLAGPLPPEAREAWCDRIAAAHAAGRHGDVTVDALTLLRQEGDAPFRVIGRYSCQG